jgi:molecular chaperone DnaK
MLWGQAAAGKLKEQIKRGASSARITNVNTHSLGIVGRNRSGDKRKVAVLIPRNTEIPHSNSNVFRTRTKGQRKIYIPIVEGESSDPDECALIGECRIVDLPEDLPERWPVTVTFAYRRDGQIVVEAQVKDAEPFHVEINRETKISTEEAETWANELIGDWDDERAGADGSGESTLPPSRVKTIPFKPKEQAQASEPETDP